MAEIKPKIVDGVKYWNIVDNKNLTYTDETGKVWKGKQAFNRKFEDNLISILNSEEDRLGRPLKKPEISALRRHKDIGMWLVDGDAASVQSVNAFVESLGTDSQGLPKKRKTLSLSVPQSNNKYFTREFIESKEFRDTHLKKWYKRLDKQGWPPGTDKKGFIKYLQDSYNQTDAYNKILEKRLGFKFQAGHIWGSMGPIGDRTTIGPYGSFSGGKFTLRNVTSQPSKPTFKQLTSKAWGIITGNVPSRFDPRGVQIEGAADLLEAGFGGQGWDGALVDYLTQGLGDIDHLDAWDKAYIAFGDPSKGDFIGKTIEARKAQILTPGGKDKILQGAADFGATSENLSGPVKTGNLFDQPFDSPQKLGNLPRDVIDQLNNIRNLPIAERRLAVKALAASGALTLFGGFGTAMSAAETYGRKSIFEETDDPLDKLQYQISAASLGGDAVSWIPTPWTVAIGSAGSLLADTANTMIDFGRNPYSEEELNKALVFSSDFEQGKTLTEGSTDTRLTAPGMVKVESDDDDEKDKYVPMLQIPKA